MSWLTKLLGDKGERLAASFLRGLGYKILARQQRNKLGEIDLVARDGDCIVFVEVKTRRSTAAGHPAEAVTTSKQQKLTNAALIWMKKQKLLGHACRFDVIAILTGEDGSEPEIQHYVNAFPASGSGQFYS